MTTATQESRDIHTDEDFFRALAAAWEGPYDREQTPQAVAPVFERFGMRPSAA